MSEKQTATPNKSTRPHERNKPSPTITWQPEPLGMNGPVINGVMRLPTISNTRTQRQAAILHLQRQHGNAHVQRLLREARPTLQREDTATPTGDAAATPTSDDTGLSAIFAAGPSALAEVVALVTGVPETLGELVDEFGTFMTGFFSEETTPAATPTPEETVEPGAAAVFGGANVFAITGHTHARGRSVTVATATDPDDPGTTGYAPANFNWDEPETTYAPFQIPTAGGFRFSCDYVNNTGRRIQFGEGVDDEMCFFWLYYYPSQGPKVCAHSNQFNPPDGIDVCCPAAEGDVVSAGACRYLMQNGL